MTYNKCHRPTCYGASRSEAQKEKTGNDEHANRGDDERHRTQGLLAPKHSSGREDRSSRYQDTDLSLCHVDAPFWRTIISKFLEVGCDGLSGFEAPEALPSACRTPPETIIIHDKSRHGCCNRALPKAWLHAPPEN